MLRTLFWTMMFFLGASLIAIQPACHDWADKPIHEPAVKLDSL